MRKSSFFIAFVAAGFALTLLMLLHESRQDKQPSALRQQARLVRDLGLTDLCLFTEARYTRHPTQADLNSAFQDSPLALEHFPSGSLVSAPQILKEQHADLD